MKKIIIFLFLICIVLSLAACGRGALQKTESEVVDAVVVNTFTSRAGKGITVEYGGARNDILNAQLFLDYKYRLGATLKCQLITRTYENQTTKQLVYNSDLTQTD